MRIRTILSGLAFLAAAVQPAAAAELTYNHVVPLYEIAPGVSEPDARASMRVLEHVPDQMQAFVNSKGLKAKITGKPLDDMMAYALEFNKAGSGNSFGSFHLFSERDEKFQRVIEEYQARKNHESTLHEQDCNEEMLRLCNRKVYTGESDDAEECLKSDPQAAEIVRRYFPDSKSCGLDSDQILALSKGLFEKGFTAYFFSRKTRDELSRSEIHIYNYFYGLSRANPGNYLPAPEY